MTDTQQNSGSRKPKSKGKIAAAWAGISAAVAAVALFLTNVEKIVAVTKNWSQRSAAEPKLEPLRVDCEVFPLRAKPGAVVTIKVTPVARNTRPHRPKRHFSLTLHTSKKRSLEKDNIYNIREQGRLRIGAN